jgi:hypothetical protein
MNRHRIVLGATLATLPLLLLGCPKKETPVVVVDSGPPPAVIDAALTELKPLDELDAGADADADAGKKATGTGLTTSQLRAKQCCNALRTQAKALGNSPESAQLLGLAATCDTIAMNLGPTKGGSAPELEPLRQIFKGKTTLPPLCSGL